METYISLRGVTAGPFFVDQAQKPISRATFASTLSTVLKYCGYDPAMFNTHSFQIGAATHAALSGVPDSQIRYMGRWKSNAFMNYIRADCTVFH